jgi:hypothetical protein
MKLYQAVKTYGLKRVRFIIERPDDEQKFRDMQLHTTTLKESTVKIKNELH